MEQYYEIVGYIGSFLVALSLSMKNIRLLRKINLVGASTFATYGILIGAIPVFALNGLIVIIDIYYIYNDFNIIMQFVVVICVKLY